MARRPALTELRTRRFTQAVIAALTAVAGGCSLQPVYERPPLPVASAYPTGPAYKVSAGEPGGVTLPAAEIGWRDFMADPRPQRLVAPAPQNKRGLRRARAHRAAARA